MSIPIKTEREIEKMRIACRCAAEVLDRTSGLIRPGISTGEVDQAAADFMAADLTEAIFDNCNLHKTVFMDTIAYKTDFTTSYNYMIDPEKNKLKKARFSKDGLAGLLTKYEIVVA